MNPFEIRANLLSDEVTVVSDNDPKNAFRYTGCTILSAKDYSCRHVLSPYEKPEVLDIKITTRDGQHIQSSQETKVCYPNQVVRWLVDWGMISRDFDAFSLVLWLLNSERTPSQPDLVAPRSTARRSSRVEPFAISPPAWIERRPRRLPGIILSIRPLASGVASRARLRRTSGRANPAATGA
jgi:hypothetical protein